MIMPAPTVHLGLDVSRSGHLAVALIAGSVIGLRHGSARRRDPSTNDPLRTSYGTWTACMRVVDLPTTLGTLPATMGSSCPELT